MNIFEYKLYYVCALKHSRADEGVGHLVQVWVNLVIFLSFCQNLLEVLQKRRLEYIRNSEGHNNNRQEKICAVKKCKIRSKIQCALGDCANIMCETHTIKICFDCMMAPYTNQTTFANKLPDRRRTL